MTGVIRTSSNAPRGRQAGYGRQVERDGRNNFRYDGRGENPNGAPRDANRRSGFRPNGRFRRPNPRIYGNRRRVNFQQRADSATIPAPSRSLAQDQQTPRTSRGPGAAQGPSRSLVQDHSIPSISRGFGATQTMGRLILFFRHFSILFLCHPSQHQNLKERSSPHELGPAMMQFLKMVSLDPSKCWEGGRY